MPSRALAVNRRASTLSSSTSRRYPPGIVTRTPVNPAVLRRWLRCIWREAFAVGGGDPFQTRSIKVPGSRVRPASRARTPMMARRIRPVGARSSPFTHSWRGPNRRTSTSRSRTGVPLVAGRSLYLRPLRGSAGFGETLAAAVTVALPESIGSSACGRTRPRRDDLCDSPSSWGLSPFSRCCWD